MSQLTVVSEGVKKYSVYAFFALVIIILGNLLFNSLASYIKSLEKFPPPVADLKFGTLPQLNTSSFRKSTSGMTLSFENVSGRIPEATATAKVYAIPQKTPSLVNASRSRALARFFNLIPEEEKLASYIYKFTDDIKTKTLTVYIIDMNFYFKYFPRTDNPANAPKTILLTDGDYLSQEAISYVRRNSLFDSSLVNKKPFTVFLSYNALTEEINIAEDYKKANALRLDFVRDDIEDYPVIYPSNGKTPYNITYYNTQLDKDKILEINYSFYPIDRFNFGTYDLVSSNQAWQDIIDGYGYIINLGNNDPSNKIIVRDFYLAYYETEDQQRYLQPVFVFTGDGGFIAMSKAILPLHYQQSEQNQPTDNLQIPSL